MDQSTFEKKKKEVLIDIKKVDSVRLPFSAFST
jgi:hypothetical protein